ncbi:MAG: M13 family metallopeptidase [Acidobacteriota bacterium]
MHPHHSFVKTLAAFSGVALVATLAVAQDTKPAAAPAPAAKVEAHPLAALPYTPSLDPSAMDRTVDPCADLYTYSCGGWVKNNPIPADQTRWSVYGKATNDNAQFLWGMLQQVSEPRAGRTVPEAETGDYFASCMDEATIEHKGALALAADVAAINQMTSLSSLPKVLAPLHLAGGYFPFGFGSSQDLKDSQRIIAFAIAGGLGLPDRDYYLKDDDKSKEIRARYVEHVEKMLTLFGDPANVAKEGAQSVMRMETALATSSLTRVEQRDPHNLDHPMGLADFQKLTPSFDWHAYIQGLGVKEVSSATEINVTQPKFFTAVETLLKTEPLPAWREYLRWHLVNERADLLNKAYVDLDFSFYRQYLRGQKEQQPRWKRCVQAVDGNLGEALGQVFVAKAFSPETKARAVDMVERIQKTMGDRIRALDWMSDTTKKQALHKLESMKDKIGYPDKWRDYSSIKIDRADYAGNSMRAAMFENRRQLAKIGHPVERGEWGMTPPTVNAYYDPQMNDMNFPAGVLLPPLFDPKMDDAPNYGNTGSTIGHELTHGFDDEGRQFDAKGDLHDWWTDDDGTKFEARAKCISDQYSQYTIVDDIKINGKLTLGEDLADLGGTLIAYDAWKDAVKGKKLENQDGLTPEQRFFVGFAQWDCNATTPEAARVSALTNPHSPGFARINGVVVNMPEFAAAFQCKAGAPMVNPPAKVCKVW